MKNLSTPEYATLFNCFRQFCQNSNWPSLYVVCCFFCVGRQLFFNRSSAYWRNKQTFPPSRFHWRHKLTLNLCNWRNKHVQKIQRGTFVSVVVGCPVSLLSDWLLHLISLLVFPTHALVSFSLSISQLLITVNWRIFQLFFFVQFFVIVVK